MPACAELFSWTFLLHLIASKVQSQMPGYCCLVSWNQQLLKTALAPQIKVLCNGIVDTLGRVNFGGRVNHPFTAHPKVDPETGEEADEVDFRAMTGCRCCRDKV